MPAGSALTRRELYILKRKAQGATNATIATELGIKDVQGNLTSSIRLKLGAVSFAQAVAMAVAVELIKLNDDDITIDARLAREQTKLLTAGGR